MFKIRNKQTGLFSTGGTSPNWNKRGKTWSGRGPVILSLLGYDTRNRIQIEDLEIVEYEHVEKSVCSAVDIMRESSERRELKEAQFRARDAEYQRERDEKAYEELRARLGK